MAKEENEKEKNKPKPCPKWLNNTAKKEWRRVAKILAEEGKDFTDKDLQRRRGRRHRRDIRKNRNRIRGKQINAGRLCVTV